MSIEIDRSEGQKGKDGVIIHKKDNKQMNQKGSGESSHYRRYMLPPHRYMLRSSSGINPKHSKATHGDEKNLTEKSDNQFELQELPSELLELVAKHLDMVSFCAFGSVCKAWLEMTNRSREDFLDSQPPMAVLRFPYSERTCYLYNMANGNIKKVMLPNFDGKFLVGCSAGYLIIEDMYRQITFLNPLTGHQLNRHAPSFSTIGRSLHDHIIFTLTLPSRNYLVLAISNKKHEYHVFHSKDTRWYNGKISELTWVDVAIFKGRVYVVSRDAQLGKLNINETDPERRSFSWLELKSAPKVDSLRLKLVVSDNQLLMVDFVPEKHLNIHKMDFDAMAWVKVDKLGEQALFFGGKWSSAIRKPGKWGGQSNCVYYLNTPSTMCCLYSMEAKLICEFPIMEHPTFPPFRSYGWYYPHQCMKIEYVTED